MSISRREILSASAMGQRLSEGAIQHHIVPVGLFLVARVANRQVDRQLLAAGMSVEKSGPI
ncbi:hypothetical protein D9M68_936580 [compost metagenome]